MVNFEENNWRKCMCHRRLLKFQFLFGAVLNRILVMLGSKKTGKFHPDPVLWKYCWPFLQSLHKILYSCILLKAIFRNWGRFEMRQSIFHPICFVPFLNTCFNCFSHLNTYQMKESSFYLQIFRLWTPKTFNFSYIIDILVLEIKVSRR